MLSVRLRRRVAAVAAGLLLAVAIAGCTTASSRTPPTPTGTASSGGPGGSGSGSPSAGGKPNFVYILSDDLSMNLLPYMKNVQDMIDHGYNFTHFFTPNSQCCPSRAATLTGRYGHNNGVLSNGWPFGGFGRYVARDDEDHSLGVHMQAAGYRTALMGKYLNGYSVQGSRSRPGGPPAQAAGAIPPGWDDWFGIDAAYSEFDYHAALSDRMPQTHIKEYGHAESDYAVDVLADQATAYIDGIANSDATDPFLLYVATFAPHGGGHRRFPAAPRDRPQKRGAQPNGWSTPEFANGDCGPVPCTEVRNGRLPNGAKDPRFNTVPTHHPRWMTRPPLGEKQLAKAQQRFVQRVQMVQSLDDLIGGVRAELEAKGLADNTYVMFASDNGFHLGEHGLSFGKQTAFDSDAQVPLVVVPPGGLSTGRTVDAFVSNVDILPTMADLAGYTPAADHPVWDGSSFTWVFRDPDHPPANWPQGAALDHHHKNGKGFNPDRDNGLSPPTYRAIRTDAYLAVVYDPHQTSKRGAGGEGELYDLSSDPNELHNVWHDQSKDVKASLRAYLDQLGTCVGSQCRMLLADPPPLD